jgi:iron complex transport system substrate-binding protein
VPLGWARRFTATSGTAEEVVALAPDIVLTGSHVAPATIAALGRMHIRIEQFAVPETVAESMDQVRRIAAIAGRPARGDDLAARIAAAARPSDTRPVPALIWQGGGLVPGPGTLADELLRRAGFRNASADYGLKQWDVLPLEYLVASPPRVLLSVGAMADQADRMTRHPALRRLAAGIAVTPYPDRLMNCGGPTIVEAMERLRAARRAVTA